MKPKKAWYRAKFHPSERDFEALATFKDKHAAKEQGHVVVPISFVVPSDEASGWPRHLHDLRLGRLVDRIRISYKRGDLDETVVRRLEGMRFVFYAHEYRWFKKTLVSLQIYKDLYGDFPIPFDFVVPNEDPQWPRKLWGKKVGLLYQTVRSRLHEYSYSRVAKLKEMGFPVDPSEDVAWTRVVLPALKTFWAKHGHVNVPHTFQVPEGDPSWPKRTWGLKLGFSVNNLRTDWDDLPEFKRRELENLEFARSVQLEHWNETLFPALQTYHKVFGHWRVPKAFCVPDQDPKWPEAMWKVQLGFVYSNLRLRSRGPLANVDVSSLQELGCAADVAPDDLMSDDQTLELQRRCWLEQVAPALAVFERHYGHLDVPLDFQVPAAAADESDDWPKQSAGVKLGALVSKMSAYDLHKHYDLYTVDFPFKWTAAGNNGGQESDCGEDDLVGET